MNVFAVLIVLALMLPAAPDTPMTTGSEACVSQADAERILGGSAQLLESKSEKIDGLHRRMCTFRSIKERQSNLYYLIETYSDTTAANRAFDGIVKANRSMAGEELVDGIGDEAWRHSDRKNFSIIVFRKGRIMVRMKVNKLARSTSVVSFYEVARTIASTI